MNNDVWTLPRNDLKAAVEFYRRAKADGTLTEAITRVLARLQDDPSRFFAAVKGV